MTKSRFVLGFGAVSSLVVITWLAARRSNSDDLGRKKLEARIAALESAEPKQAERLIEREIRVDLNSAPAPSAFLPRMAPEAGAEPNTDPALTARSNEELADAYAASFVGESVDPSWALDTERRLEPVLRRALPASSRLMSFECRSKFCDAAV